MKIGLLTTLDTNIGDDFIRLGICRVLSDIYRPDSIEFVSVNKHQPYTVYPPTHPIHLRKYLGVELGQNGCQKLFDGVFSFLWKSDFHRCDMIVQCGAPVFWPYCGQNEWAKPIWYDVIGRVFDKIPVLNLAAGSCFPWIDRENATPKPEDVNYISDILRFCSLTTVRDRFAKKLCASLGVDVPMIPCSALLSPNGQRATCPPSGYIIINYMRGGGHYDWSQGISHEKWDATTKELVHRLAKRHKVIFLCHNEEEKYLAMEMGLSLPIYFPKTPKEYFNCVAGAKFGICNRMHASVAMAGMGVPSIAICTDTRLLMVEALGLKTHFVEDVTVELLEDEAEDVLLRIDQERLRLLELEEWTRAQYLSVIKERNCLSLRST